VGGVSSASDLRQQDIRTGITRVACGDDAVEPHGLTSAAVEAGDVVARSTAVDREMYADHNVRT